MKREKREGVSSHTIPLFGILDAGSSVIGGHTPQLSDPHTLESL